MIKLRYFGRCFAALVVGLVFAVGWPNFARAQTDEIQVYTSEVAEPGVVNLTWHNNYTPDGHKTPVFPGGLVPDHTYNGVTE